MAASQGQIKPQLHALVLSFPVQGHITPLMQLAHRLIDQCQDFLVTYLIPHNLPAPAAAAQDQNRLRIVPIRAYGHHRQHREGELHEQEEIMEAMQEPVEELLSKFQLQASDQQQTDQSADMKSPDSPCYPPITLIISDVFMTWSWEVARRFNLPLVAFYTANATSASVLCHAQMLQDRGIVPFKDPSQSMVDCIPGVRPLRGDEFPPSMQCKDTGSERLDFTKRMWGHVAEAEGLVLNTVYEMEAGVIEALRGELGVGVWAVGPLLLRQPQAGNEESWAEREEADAEEEEAEAAAAAERDLELLSKPDIPLWEEDDQCLQWLSARSASSVLYVSFGSLATYSQAQFQELALGIEASGRPFLWVVRPDAVAGRPGGRSALPEGFLARTADRGFVVSWAPQLRVLAHPAVGGFLTHCGWNSILESLSLRGTPMLCWPGFADQMLNRRLLVDDWRVALDFRRSRHVAGGDRAASADVAVDRAEVERVVRALFESELGADVGRRAAEMRRLVRRAVKLGGSSYSDVEALLHNLRAKAHSPALLRY